MYSIIPAIAGGRAIVGGRGEIPTSVLLLNICEREREREREREIERERGTPTQKASLP